jgi:hypothetical protein
MTAHYQLQQYFYSNLSNTIRRTFTQATQTNFVKINEANQLTVPYKESFTNQKNWYMGLLKILDDTKQ